MASRVEFAISATPIYSHAAGEGLASDVMATDVGHTVGGNGSVTVTWGTTSGYSAGSPVYESSGGYLTVASCKFIYVKHTGYAYSSSSALGAAVATTLTLTIGDSSLDESVLAVLNPGEAIILPFAVAKSFSIGTTASSGTIAVEWFATS